MSPCGNGSASCSLMRTLTMVSSTPTKWKTNELARDEQGGDITEVRFKLIAGILGEIAAYPSGILMDNFSLFQLLVL